MSKSKVVTHIAFQNSDPDLSGYDRLGCPSSQNKMFYIYVWDPIKKKHIGKFSKRNEYDILG